jgi:cytochrome c
MNRRSAITLASALLCAGFGLSGVAVAQGTAAEAKAMLQKAVTEMKANPAAAIAKFNKADGGFRDRDLYVFCFEMGSGKIVAHVNPNLVSMDVRALKEKDGSPFGQKIYDAAKEGAIETVSYNAPKPGSTDPIPKESYITRVGDYGCGVGYFK